MTYDLIIVSRSDHPALINYTQAAIDSCLSFAEEPVNVILIETGPVTKYIGVNKLIEYKGEFNYNRALNQGLQFRKSDIQILANNDIIFYPGWSKIGDIMRMNGYLSTSAISNDTRHRGFRKGEYAYEGYAIGFQLAGWCIFCDSRLWNIIGQLDETHQFWFSDNAYTDQLRARGIKHALICSVRVHHHGSQTLKRTDRKTRILYTNAERKRIITNNTKNISPKLRR